jgi:hypothetical protein
VKEDEMGRACSMHGGKRNVCRNVVVRPEGKISPGRPRYRWDDNIKMGIREGGMTWTDLAQNYDHRRAHVNEAMNLPVP